MNNVKKILKYNHPAAMGYDLTKTYDLDDLKKVWSLEMIKIIFEPVNFEWMELEHKDTAKPTADKNYS